MSAPTPAYSLVGNGIGLRRQRSGHCYRGHAPSVLGQRPHGYALAEGPQFPAASGGLQLVLQLPGRRQPGLHNVPRNVVHPVGHAAVQAVVQVIPAGGIGAAQHHRAATHAHAHRPGGGAADGQGAVALRGVRLGAAPEGSVAVPPDRRPHAAEERVVALQGLARKSIIN